MIAALLLSFGVIFVAELGDKSQLMAMTYALRYKWWIVLLAITVATTAVHAVSVFFGHFLGLSIPSNVMSIVAGIAMLIFGLWTLRGDSLDDAEQGALCLDIDWVVGGCMDLAGDDPHRMDCGATSSKGVKVSEIQQGVNDVESCPTDGGYIYKDRRFVVCTEEL